RGVGDHPRAALEALQRGAAVAVGDAVLDEKGAARPLLHPAPHLELVAQAAGARVAGAGLEQRHALHAEVAAELGIGEAVGLEEPLGAAVEPEVEVRVEDDAGGVAVRPLDGDPRHVHFHRALLYAMRGAFRLGGPRVGLLEWPRMAFPDRRERT